MIKYMKICKHCGKEFLPHKKARHSYCSDYCRFWDNVDIRKPDECWQWRMHKIYTGYGYFTLKNRPIRTNRISWIFSYGDIPDGLFVLHHCDNPSCCNPNHLFLGTQMDNMHDMISKGHKVVKTGSSNFHAKLSEDDILNIRTMYSNGIYQKDIAKQFGICQQSVSLIVNRINWKHITPS